MRTVAGDEIGAEEIDGRSLLDEIAREGARRMLVAALETEVAAYLDAHVTDRDADGHAWSCAMAEAARGRSRWARARSPSKRRASTIGGSRSTAGAAG
jgi:hypothetical protein